MKDKLLQIEKYSGSKNCEIKNCQNKAKIKVIVDKNESHYCIEHFNQLRNNFDDECAKFDDASKVENSINETLYI